MAQGEDFATRLSCWVLKQLLENSIKRKEREEKGWQTREGHVRMDGGELEEVKQGGHDSR